MPRSKISTQTTTVTLQRARTPVEAQAAALQRLRASRTAWNRLSRVSQQQITKAIEHASKHDYYYTRIEVFFDWSSIPDPKKRAAIFRRAGYPEEQAQQMSEFYGNPRSYPCLVCSDFDSVRALLSIRGAPRVGHISMMGVRSR